MFVLDLIAEEKIAAAIARGDLSNLPGAGRPLDLDDDLLIPKDLRMAYRILKNAGFVPPEVQVLREISDLQRLIDTLDAGDARSLALRKLQLLRTRLASATQGQGRLRLDAAYIEHIYDRLGKRSQGS